MKKIDLYIILSLNKIFINIKIKKTKMKKILLLLTLTFLLGNSYARKFYFSSSGSDTYTTTQAQSQATPWQTLKKLTSLTSGTNGPTVFKPGDTICFKRGDVFYGSSTDTYVGVYWWNDGGTYFTAPSGTPTAPIVITNYGDVNLPLPNWLHARAFYPVSTWAPHIDSANASIGITTRIYREGRGIIQFAGVSNIIIDGIQSNDFRIPSSDKTNPGFSGGWVIGEWTKGNSTIRKNSYSDSTRRVNMVKNFTIRNCTFNNLMYGIQGFAGVDSKVTNCTFTNFKSTADTAGTNDVLAGAFEGINGIRCEFSYNNIKGAWAKSGRISSTNGLGGIGFDMFNLYNSRICYNTIVDCSGAFEIGNLDTYDSTAGFQYDTIAFNKIINTGQFGYFHGTGFFAGNNHHIGIWNNVVILNNKDRQSGVGFGSDVYGDGQGFRPGTSQAWWFCRNPYSTFNPPNYPLKPTITTTAGSNIITVSSATGIVVGSVFFMDNDSLASLTYKTVTVTAINGNNITLSSPVTATRTNMTLGDESGFYLPVSDQTWSQPQNPPYSNYGGTRSIIQYATDATLYGSYIDTLFDSRNNIFYWTNGTQGVYDRNRYKRSSNIYYPRGGTLNPSVLGGTLNFKGTGEILATSGTVFADTTASLPENWDLHLAIGSPGIGTGKSISGFDKDFGGTSLNGTMDIGLYKFVGTQPSPTITNVSPTSTVNGTVVTLTGTNFTSASSVVFSANLKTIELLYTVVNSTTITVTMNITGAVLGSYRSVTGTFTVTTPTGTATSSTVTYIAPPVFTKFTVGTSTSTTGVLSASPGATVVINGKGFTGTTAVKFGVTNATSFTVVNDTTINAVVGNGTTGTVSITTPGGTISSSGTFTVLVPTVSSFYYNKSNKSIYIKCNVAGTITVRNGSNVVVKTSTYAANGVWVSMSSLTAGTYTATTYTSTLTFTR
jgi:hypothetical protein